MLCGEVDLLGDRVARRIRRGRERKIRLGGAERGGARVRERARAPDRHVSLWASDVRGDGLLGDRAYRRRRVTGGAGLRKDLEGGRQDRVLENAGEGGEREDADRTRVRR